LERIVESIAPFTIEAYDEAFTLWQRCEGIGLSDADSRENIRMYLDRNPNMSFLAKAEGKVVGTVLCGHDGRRGYIHHLAVLPEYRRRGIARRLVDRCVDTLSKAAIPKCNIFIFNENFDGIRFWTSIGWQLRTDIGVISKLTGCCQTSNVAGRKAISLEPHAGDI